MHVWRKCAKRVWAGAGDTQPGRLLRHRLWYPLHPLASCALLPAADLRISSLLLQVQEMRDLAASFGTPYIHLPAAPCCQLLNLNATCLHVQVQEIRNLAASFGITCIRAVKADATQAVRGWRHVSGGSETKRGAAVVAVVDEDNREEEEAGARSPKAAKADDFEGGLGTPVCGGCELGWGFARCRWAWHLCVWGIGCDWVLRVPSSLSES